MTNRCGAACGSWGWPVCWIRGYTSRTCTAMIHCARTCGSWGLRESETTWNTTNICAVSPASVTQTSVCSYGLHTSCFLTFSYPDVSYPRPLPWPQPQPLTLTPNRYTNINRNPRYLLLTLWETPRYTNKIRVRNVVNSFSTRRLSIVAQMSMRTRTTFPLNE